MTNRPLLSFDDRGEGSALVFVHGFLNDASVWSAVIDELQSEFRCIAIDLPGHGGSTPTGAGTYTRDHVLDDIRRLLDHLGIERAVFVGHSLGGYLSLALAIEDPGRVSGLGLVGAGPGFRSPTSREKWNDSIRALVSERDLPDGMEVISMHFDSMVMDRIAEISAPAAVVLGERDKGFMASAEVFAKHLTIISQTVVPGTGHMVHAKGPVQVAAALREAFAAAASG